MSDGLRFRSFMLDFSAICAIAWLPSCSSTQQAAGAVVTSPVGGKKRSAISAVSTAQGLRTGPRTAVTEWRRLSNLYLGSGSRKWGIGFLR
jgi:hypothetical protein